VSAYDYGAVLRVGTLKAIHPMGGVFAEQAIASRLQREWPMIGPDHRAEQGLGRLKEEDEIFLLYAFASQKIELLLYLQGDANDQECRISIRFYCNNPPAVVQTFQNLIEWLMTNIGMQCCPRIAHGHPRSLEYWIAAPRDARDEISKQVKDQQTFWRDNVPESCRISLLEPEV
jgi:hypothetical protein